MLTKVIREIEEQQEDEETDDEEIEDEETEDEDTLKYDTDVVCDHDEHDQIFSDEVFGRKIKKEDKQKTYICSLSKHKRRQHPIKITDTFWYCSNCKMNWVCKKCGEREYE